MSRLTDLIGRVRDNDSALAADLEREVEILGQRRAFGLNFERHVPETVQLPQRRIRRGDKVVFLPERGAEKDSVDDRVWLVTGFSGQGAKRKAKLVRRGGKDEPEETSRPVEDLVVVAEFRDPIYPGLLSTGKVERGGDKPFHSVINGENYHALEALRFAYEGKVDCIYIDPPYNTRDKDWKYNNDYVDSDDRYRHSKWLAMVERRLRVAGSLLNPEHSVLIVTIDEKEYLRLGLLLEQVFPEARIQMVSSVISQKGVARGDQFYRTDEYIFFVAFGSASVASLPLDEEWRLGKRASAADKGIVWSQLRRSGTNSRREDRPTLFFPIFIDPEGPRIHSVGESLPLGVDPSTVSPPAGTVAEWPIRSDGEDGNWQQSQSALATLVENGYVKVGKHNANGYPLSYLKRGSIEKITSGQVKVTGRAEEDGHVLVDASGYERRFVPGTQWNISSHDATYHGTQLLTRLIGQDRFPFPKSLYAVEDALRFFVGDNPDAIVLDFFAGSGTTAHAVARLNQEDGGNRVSVCVTNNEVSAEEAASLEKKKLRPGDADWEAFGICEYVTRPRLEAAFTGMTLDGEPVKGDYKFNSEASMAGGLAENIEFFKLTYEDPARVKHGLGFKEVAPLLWLRAGSQGRQILATNQSFDVAERYGVLFNIDSAAGFMEAVKASEGVRIAFIVTDDEGQYQSIASQLPSRVEAVRLYEAYLENARIGPRTTQ